MRLHFQSVGTGFPVIILHGLFGSSDNWQSFARHLGVRFRVLLPDQRNHGRSPHSEDMSYPAMAEDIRQLMDNEGIHEAHLIGHSMGGKTAMQLALIHPSRVRSLVVVDIAPREYERRHDAILNALVGLDLSSYKTRQEIEDALAPAIPDTQVRRFLLKGVSRVKDRFVWRMGVQQLADNYDTIGAAVVAEGTYEGPCLFVYGELSSYLGQEDRHPIQSMFPAARFACVPKASHWVHADNPVEFTRAVDEFLTAQAEVGERHDDGQAA